MSKVVDLRREVKERLSKKGVVDLSEFKLKPIDIKDNNSKVRSALERNLKKIGKSLVKSVFDLNISNEEKVDKLNELLVGSINTRVEITNDGEAIKVIDILKKGKDLGEEEVYFCVVVEEGNFKATTYSTLHYEPPKSKEGHFTLRSNRGAKGVGFSSLSKLVGTIYFHNKLIEYIRANEDMSKLIYLKYVQMEGVYKNHNHKKDINSLAKQYNIPSSDDVSLIVSDIPERRQVAFEKNRYYNYLNWNEIKDYFNTESIFLYHIHRAESIYQLYAITNPAITSHFLNYIYDLNVEEEYDVKEEFSLGSDYARSYETKKNIPLKVLNKMENSEFKQHFGYVEFDELVDLEKVEIIEKEWIEINKKVVFPVAKDHSLRFRRLGKHKASGLYFSGEKAVCVDLTGPSSLVHEVMHMIDYTTLSNTTLSSMFNFRGIIERYRDVVNDRVNALEKTNSFRVEWNKNNKYSKAYYLSVKEIFARCGELYISHILGIDSSLVKANNDNLYPKNDEFLLEIIEKYYSSIIQLAPARKEVEKVASSPSKVLTESEVTSILEVGQVSFFDII